MSLRGRLRARPLVYRSEAWVRTALNLAPPHPLGAVLHAYARAVPDAFFIQVGSHDATLFDPLRQHILRRRWRGILVEPVPWIFERLRRHYASVDGLVFENVAIADHDGTVAFHCLADSDDEGLPPWYDGLGSLNREVILKHRNFIPDIDSRVRTMTVPCKTLSTLCADHAVAAVDVIHIDAEGYDFEILKQVDLDRLRPDVVQYEELHMDATTRAAVVAFLDARGYDTIHNGMDALGLRRDAAVFDRPAFARAWKRAR